MYLLFGSSVRAAEDTRLFDVPRIDGITIDGQQDDWQNAGLSVEVMTSVEGWVMPVSDLDCRFSLGWDERGLLVLIQVRDGSFMEAGDIEKLYEGDCVELYLADKRGGKQMMQAVIAPGMASNQSKLRYHLYDYRRDEVLKAKPLTLTAARRKTPNGYVMEVLLPWANIGVTPEVGREVAFQMFCDDYDIAERLFNAVWYPSVGTFQDSKRTHRIRLTEKPGPACSAVARGFVRGDDAWFSLVAASRLTGKVVSARFDGKELTTGKLTEYGGRSYACLKATLPPDADEASRFEIMVDGVPLEPVTLLDLEGERCEQALPLGFTFAPFCFSGDGLPPGVFRDAARVQRLLGPHEVKVTYYDAEFHAVTSAPKPGRYGAIVEIVPRFHPPMLRYYTLFRTEGDVKWKETELSLQFKLPPNIGLDPAVVHRESESVDELVRNTLLGMLAQSEASAVWLAWLGEQDAVAPPATDRNGCRAANARWLHELKRRNGLLLPLKYLASLPGNIEKKSARKWPTILYLHGSGGRGLPVAALNGTSGVFQPRKHKPDTFIIIAPRCPQNRWWSIPALEDLLAEVMDKYPIDKGRIYVTGESMGGFATWELAAAHPDRFAAIAPICGGGDPREAELIKDLPTWVFHGAKDRGVLPERSREMVNALRDVRGRVRYTEYPNLGHRCWGTAYNNEALYDWMLQQVRGKPGEPRVKKTRFLWW